MKEFTIIRNKENGCTYLASNYFLDPSQKFTVYCEFTEGVEPIMGRYGMWNEYKYDVDVIGEFVSDRYEYSSRNEISEVK